MTAKELLRTINTFDFNSLKYSELSQIRAAFTARVEKVYLEKKQKREVDSSKKN